PGYPMSSLMPHLIGDVVRLVDLAMRTLRNQCVAVAEGQSTRRHDPGLDKRLGVVDGRFVQEFIALARELLDDAHVAGMEETATSQPRLIGERDGVDHQGIALPLSDGVAKIGRLS